MANYKRDCFNEGDAGIGFAAGIVVPQVIIFVLFLIYSSVALSQGIEFETLLAQTIPSYINTAVIELLFFAIYLVVCNIFKVSAIKAGGLNKGINLKSLPVIIVLGIVLVLFFSPIVGCLDYLISLTGYNLTTELNLPLGNFGDYALAVVLIAFLPAFCEEILFRGLILNGLRKYGMWKAILISALCFMLMHGNIQQTVYTFFLGIVLGYVFYKTRSLWASIIVHFVNNLVVITMMYLTQTGVLSDEVVTINWQYVLYALGAMIIGLGLLALAGFLLKHFNKEKIRQEKAEPLLTEDGSAVPVKTASAGKEEASAAVNAGAQQKEPFKSFFKNTAAIVFFGAGLVLAIFLWGLDFLTKLGGA